MAPPVISSLPDLATLVKQPLKNQEGSIIVITEKYLDDLSIFDREHIFKSHAWK